jgi:hypothetical protein
MATYQFNWVKKTLGLSALLKAQAGTLSLSTDLILPSWTKVDKFLKKKPCELQCPHCVIYLHA